MVPVAGRVLVSGVILTWTRALGEFGATILFAGNLEGVTQTMPMAIYLGFERNLGVALALAVVLIAVPLSCWRSARGLRRRSNPRAWDGHRERGVLPAGAWRPVRGISQTRPSRMCPPWPISYGNTFPLTSNTSAGIEVAQRRFRCPG